MQTVPLRVRRYRDDDFEPIVRLWIETKADAYPYLPLEQTYSWDDNAGFFRDVITASCEIWIAEDERGPAGFLAIRESYIDRLYIHPTRQREGVGSRLLQKAQELSPCGLELHTHQKNESACRFYEKHGMEAVHFGISPAPESEPDVEYQWRPNR